MISKFTLTTNNSMKKYCSILLFSLLVSLGVNQLSAQVVSSTDEPIVLDRILAVVGGHPVFQSDVEAQYLQAKAMGYSTQGDMKCSIFEQLLQTKLLLNQSEIDSIEVTNSEVESEVKRRIQGLLQEANGSEQMITDYFKKSMLEIEKDMFKPVREQILTQRMQADIVTDARITPSEVQKFFKTIPKNQIPLIPETLEIRQIVMKPTVPESAKEAVKAKLNEYREQIINGRSMATLAILYSEDPGSSSKGGELGLLPRNVLDPEFVRVAYNLKKGDVSRVVKSAFGYHIMELIERQGDLINVRHILLRAEVPIESKIQVKQDLDSIANAIRSGTITFEKAAQTFSADEKSRVNGGLMVNEYSASAKFEPKDLTPAMLVAIKDLNIGEISKPFETVDESQNTAYKIISLKEKTAAHRADIDMDYQYIQQMALNSKQQEIVDEWIEDKQRNMYIRIHDDFKNCEFNYKGWIK